MVVDIIYHRDVLRWGKNIISAKTQTRKRAGTAVYNRASSLETLVSWLSVPNKCKSLGRSHGKAGILNWFFYTADFRGTSSKLIAESCCLWRLTRICNSRDDLHDHDKVNR
ncbi:hypothetical protein Patl1_33467 [Pistacia atlantica]|uniref:Uncharacterized protein n=1 Tax=Pistacia atlantica TaxID=434234 RepID=A0ACC0ZT41_9ROSI|nr:hypothetical protein Patl1_33467 [Pistacia atlantica]